MDDCCGQKADELIALRGEHKKVLIAVLIINAVLFLVEAAAGFLANSTALLADSLDMLGDSLVYGFSLYVLWLGALWKARAALLKGVIMALFGMGLRRFSMSPAFVPMIKALLASITTAQAERFAHQVLQLKTSEEIRGYLTARLHEISSDLEFFDFT